MNLLTKVFSITSLIFLAACGGGSGALPEPTYVVSTFAGTADQSGTTDGTGSVARFNSPQGIVFDSFGNIFVMDGGNSTIRKITPSGVVTTFAGTPGQRGSADGVGASASFEDGRALAIDRHGNLFVTEPSSNTVRKITPDGVVSTFAGSAGQSGSADGVGAEARFNFPYGVAVDALDNVIVSDMYNGTIRKITPNGVVTTIAGTAGMSSINDGIGADARFHFPAALAVDKSGNIYVTEWDARVIRKITPAGHVTTVAGTLMHDGSVDGNASSAQFSYLNGLTVDKNGNIFVVDFGNQTIRKITAAGMVSTIAGMARQSGSTDGQGLASKFNQPAYIAIDNNDNLFVSEIWNHTIRKLTISN